jgi:hypothetical protein
MIWINYPQSRGAAPPSILRNSLKAPNSVSSEPGAGQF